MVLVPSHVPAEFISMYLPAIYAALIVGFIGSMAIALNRRDIHILILTDLIGLAMIIVVSAVGTDLAEALKNGEILAAGLDVIEGEPLELTNPLSELKDSNQLIITPHLAWGSVEARTRCVDEVYRNIEAFMHGEDRNIVNP